MNIDYTAIGLRIKQIRGPLSQKEFADQFQLSKSYINNLEHGSKPSLEFLFKVSQAFDVSLDWLISGVGQMQRTPSPTLAKLLQLFNSLTPEAQSLMLGAMKTIIKNSRGNVGETAD